MKPDRDELDQRLMEAILALDVEGVEAALRAGASVTHGRARDDMPVGPRVTPVSLSHRMKDVVARPGVDGFRKFPSRVTALLKAKVKEHTKEFGRDEVKARIERICTVIAKKLGKPRI